MYKEQHCITNRNDENKNSIVQEFKAERFCSGAAFFLRKQQMILHVRLLFLFLLVIYLALLDELDEIPLLVVFVYSWQHYEMFTAMFK